MVNTRTNRFRNNTNEEHQSGTSVRKWFRSYAREPYACPGDSRSDPDDDSYVNQMQQQYHQMMQHMMQQQQQ